MPSTTPADLSQPTSFLSLIVVRRTRKSLACIFKAGLIGNCAMCVGSSQVSKVTCIRVILIQPVLVLLPLVLYASLMVRDQIKTLFPRGVP